MKKTCLKRKEMRKGALHQAGHFVVQCQLYKSRAAACRSPAWVPPQPPQPTQASSGESPNASPSGVKEMLFFKEWKQPPAAWPLVFQEVRMNWKSLPYWLPGTWTPREALAQAQAIEPLLQPCLGVSVGCDTFGKITPSVQELMVIFQFTLLGRNNGAMRRSG